MRYLILLLFLSSCGEGKIPLGAMPHVLSFELDFGVKVTSTIQFVDKITAIDGAVGVCYPTNVIQLDINYWRQSHDEANMVIYHELGHCVLKQGHRDGLLPDGCHASIMHSEMDTLDCYKKHRKELVREMQEVRAREILLNLGEAL